MLTIKNILMVGVGGMIGSILRFTITILVGNQSFPFATFCINIIGSFIIGIVLGMAVHQFSSNTLRLFLATGICGGFTTFAAFSIESMQMLQQQKYVVAATYITGSIVLSIAAACTGFYISRT
ncbi:fluoride efflux transporter CrcB [Aridibaculum aurantiacum]|uniref:fluoride efflux transporter CrcB n=1 Tax=Aridibaculum aurantiacum TaxID=2810307 RepID=UPI001A96EE19|nr:fluoride efflux transporter CrcB [Aridibaculum aurantiacum]